MQPYCVCYICTMRFGKYSSRWDSAGMTASILCAIHCAIVPVLITVLPLAGLGFLANPLIEWSMIGLAIIIGSYAIGLSYVKVHRKKLPLVLLMAGFLVIILGHIFTQGWREAIVVPIGGLLITASHFANYRYSAHCSIPHFSISLQHEHPHKPVADVSTD